jgi:hypothetical protein
MAPSQYKLGGGAGMLMEIEEKYDLGADEMAEGYGSDDNGSSNSDEQEEQYDASAEDDYA